MKNLVIALSIASVAWTASAATPSTPCAFPEQSYLLDLVTVAENAEAQSFTPAQVASLDRVLKAQILAATDAQDLASAQEAIERSEDGTILVRRFSSALLPSAYYTQVTYYPGGNEYGAIFTTKSPNPAARIQDGEIIDCRVRAGSVASELAAVPFVDGSNPTYAALKGFDELTPVETFGSIGDAELVWSLAARARIPGINALQLKQLARARRAIEHFSSAYGEALSAGRYLEDQETSWDLHVMADAATGALYDVVHFNESDDGSHTVVFEEGSTRIAYVYYEN